jgi:hypothetical protein
MKSRLQIVARFDAVNLASARIIAADPERYPGGAQEWARLVLARLRPRPNSSVRTATTQRGTIACQAMAGDPR